MISLEAVFSSKAVPLYKQRQSTPLTRLTELCHCSTATSPVVWNVFVTIPLNSTTDGYLQQTLPQIAAAQAICLLTVEPMAGLSAVTPSAVQELATYINQYQKVQSLFSDICHLDSQSLLHAPFSMMQAAQYVDSQTFSHHQQREYTTELTENPNLSFTLPLMANSARLHNLGYLCRLAPVSWFDMLMRWMAIGSPGASSLLPISRAIKWLARS